uniref:Bm11019 n=1 Tax=Brugia malayi TaxID=6279 RepID=A0A0H5SR79_BRUMA|nr:Bm11019 [Brugia malayi]
MDPSQLPNDINEKFCSIDEERQVVAITADSFSKSVVPKVPSGSYENLQWIIEKTQFAPHRVRNDRTTTAPPFMPAEQIPSEFGKLTIPHVTRASFKSHGNYGSIHVMLQDEKLQEKSLDSENESLDEGITKKNYSNSNDNSYLPNSQIATSTKLLSLTAKEWVTICELSIANLAGTSAYSCIAPFYSNEAKIKGLRSFEIGVVFGVFELIMFFIAPLFGKYMVSIGSKKMFVSGIGVTGITVVLFGFLNYIESPSLFFWSSIGLRILEAIGDAAFVTSSFVIGVKCFPGRIAIVVGVLETFVGLGSTAGPLLGGILYEIGGFKLPFIVLGIILLFLGLVAYFLVENMDDTTIMDYDHAVVMCAISLSFLDPTLADHLASFKLTPSIIGLMFLLSGGIYTITAPFWSIIIDKFNCSKAIIMFGIIAVVISMIIIGPSPFLNAEKNLGWIEVALGILGLATSALYIPTFQISIDTLCEYGYGKSLQTYGCISGLFQSAYSFGSFFGPTVGGFCVQWIVFRGQQLS